MRIERPFVQDDAARKQWIGVRGECIEVYDIAIVRPEAVPLRFRRIEMKCRIGLVAPTISPNFDLIEPAMLRIGHRKLRPEQLGTRSQIHDAAVRIKISVNVRSPAIPEIDRSFEPLL